MNKKLIVALAVASTAIAGPAFADCPVLTNQLVNGQVSDATKLMTDLNQLRDCLNNGQLIVPPAPSVVVTSPAGGTATIRNPSTSTSYDLNLPTGPGAAGQTLTSAGPGLALTWQSPSAATKPPLTDGYPVLRPVPSSLTWTNQGAAMMVDRPNGPVTLTIPGAASATFRGLYQAPPSAAPYTLTVKMDSLTTYQSANMAGTYVIDSTGKITAFGMINNTLAVMRYSSVTSGASVVFSLSLADVPHWLRIYDDGTKWNYYASQNGADWTLFYSENLTAYLGATISGVGVAGAPGGSSLIGNPLSIWSFEVKSGLGTDSSWQ